MSELTAFPTNSTLLAQRLQSAEKSIGFIQREHAITLVSLHEEIAKWQQKCSDLTFQLAINGAVIDSTDTNKLQEKVKQLEKELDQCREKIGDLTKLLEEKDRLICDYENRLLINDRKHSLELHIQHDKQRELQIELEHRAILITQLTDQIHRGDKQQQSSVRNPIRLGQIILPNKPPRIKHNDDQHVLSSYRRVSNRSTSLCNRINNDQELTEVLFIGRRPPTPPQQLQPLYSKPFESNEEQFPSKRQRQLWNHSHHHHHHHLDWNNVTSLRSTKKVPDILPPIINKKMPLKAMATTTLQREGEA